MTKKKQSTGVIDVKHEEVKTNGLPAVQAEILTEEQIINREVQKFNLSDSKVQELREQYKGLEIAGPEDKAGYEAVKAAWNEVRSVRTGLEKMGVALRNRFNVITKGIKKEEDRLTKDVGEIEVGLYDKWKKIDQDKEAAKLEKERLEQEKLQARVAELLDAGMQTMGGFYEIGGSVSIDPGTLRMLDDAKYGKFLAIVKARNIELDEAARAEAAQRAEEKRLQEEQRVQFERQAREMEKQKAELEQMKKEAAELQYKNRIARVTGLGMEVDRRAGEFTYCESGFHVVHSIEGLMQLDDYGFEQHLEILTGEVKHAKNQAEEARQRREAEEKQLAEKQRFIIEAMTTAGLLFDEKLQVYYFKNDYIDLVRSMKDLQGMERSAIENLRRIYRKDIEEAKIKQEEARQAAQGDAGNWGEYIQKLLAIPIPAFTTQRYVDEAKKLEHHLTDKLLTH
jgi:hypothetical protein